MYNKKSILLIHPHNFLNKDSGTDNYIYKIVKELSEYNVSIDLIGVKQEKIWDNFKEQNKQEGNIIKNLTLINFGAGTTENNLMYFYSDIDMKQVFKEKKHYDLIICAYAYSYNVLNYFYSNYKLYLVIDFLSLQTSYFDNSLNNFHKHIADEIQRMSFFDAFVYISYDELTFFSHIFSKPAYFLPHFEKPMEIKQTNPHKILFLGYNNPFNIDAANWLINEITPNLSNNIKITIAGKVCDYIEDDPRIEKLGYVDNLEDLYSKTKIVICPIKMGTGMKIKVVEAMTKGIPIISHPIGLDGLPNKMDTGIIVASTGLDFANAISKLLVDVEFYNECREKIKKHYSELYNNYKPENVIKNILDYKPSLIKEWWTNIYIPNNNYKKRKITFLEYIFSVYTLERFIEIYILGVKISIKRKGK